jgi:hypothetical protein
MAALLLLSACGRDQTIRDVRYGRYGILNEAEMRNPDISYRLIIGNIVWAVVLAETIIAPIYFIGFDLWEPVGPQVSHAKGQVGS